MEIASLHWALEETGKQKCVIKSSRLEGEGC